MRRGCRFFFPALFSVCALLSRGEPHAVLKLAAWIAIAFLLGRFVRPAWAFAALAGAGVAESALGTFQFVFHTSIGFGLLGEPVLGPLDGDIARTFVSGGRLLRAYGTFPHPNILAAFLVLSLAAWLYFFMRARARARIALMVPIFAVCLGLLLTFSRAGWVAAAAVVFGMCLLVRKSDRPAAQGVLLSVSFTAFSLAVILWWAVFPRIDIGAHDYTITSRTAGYGEAAAAIRARPWFGSGMTLRMGSDPVHSLYLSIAKETGLAGLAVFLAWMGSALRVSFRDPSHEIRTFGIMLGSLLLLGLSDHFLWTLRPGAAMLWGVVGLISFRSRS